MIGGNFIGNLFHRRPILCGVIIAHAVALLVIVTVDLVQAWQTPDEEIIQVQLLEDLPVDDETSGPLGDPEVPEPEPEPEPESEPEPEPEPAPEPESEPEPEPTPEPEPEPSWQPRSSDDIRLDGLQQAEQRPRERTPQQPRPEPTPERSARDIAESARQQVSRQGLTVDIPEFSRQPTVSRSDANRYLSAIITLLTREWKQPSISSVPSGQRKATVSLTISADGRIQQAGISRSSGNPAMDQSVRNIFQNLRQLPPPRDYNIRTSTFEVNVVFELEE